MLANTLPLDIPMTSGFGLLSIENAQFSSSSQISDGSGFKQAAHPIISPSICKK